MKKTKICRSFKMETQQEKLVSSADAALYERLVQRMKASDMATYNELIQDEFIRLISNEYYDDVSLETLIDVIRQTFAPDLPEPPVVPEPVISMPQPPQKKKSKIRLPWGKYFDVFFNFGVLVKLQIIKISQMAFLLHKVIKI